MARGRRIQSLPFCFGVRRLDAALFGVPRLRGVFNVRLRLKAELQTIQRAVNGTPREMLARGPRRRRTPNYFRASGLIFIVSR